MGICKGAIGGYPNADERATCIHEEHHIGPHLAADGRRWHNGMRPPEMGPAGRRDLVVGDVVTLIYRNGSPFKVRKTDLEDLWLRAPAVVVRRTQHTVWVRTDRFPREDLEIRNRLDWFLLDYSLA